MFLELDTSSKIVYIYMLGINMYHYYNIFQYRFYHKYYLQKVDF